MASKSNINRKRIIRSAILTASMLSLIPLVGVMQSTAAKTDSNVVAAVTSAGEPIPSSTNADEATQAASTTPSTASTASTSSAPPATTASSTTAKQTTGATQTTTATSYTRTKAS